MSSKKRLTNNQDLYINLDFSIINLTHTNILNFNFKFLVAKLFYQRTQFQRKHLEYKVLK